MSKLTTSTGVYEGELVNGLPHGKGIFYFNDGGRYEGDFLKGTFTGKGKMIYTFPSEGYYYEGDFVNGLRNGQGVYKFPSGTRYEGGFVNNEFHGYGMLCDESENVLKVGQWSHNNFVETIDTVPTSSSQIKSSFLGLVREGNCPICDFTLAPTLDTMQNSMWLCPNCGEYLEKSDNELIQVDTTTMLPKPAFAAPTPWMDMMNPMDEEDLHLTTAADFVKDYLTDVVTNLVLVKKDGIRVLDAKWPEGCSVCGMPSKYREQIGKTFEFYLPGGLQVRKHRTTLVAKGIPCCEEHKRGVEFGPVNYGIGGPSFIGIFFRSYAYQREFRRLNPWTWSR